MLEGLEISEVILSDLEYSGRLDAEYYRPEYLRSEKLLRIRNSKPLFKISDFLIGPFGSAFTVENYTEDKTYRYIRGKDVKQMCLMNDDNVYMPKADFERLSKYALREHDILVSVVGTLGNAAIVEGDDLPAIFSCKSTVLRTNGINPCYLLAYLNSKYGRSLLLRKERGAIQKGLNLDDLRTLAVFVAGNVLQEVIEKVYKKSIEIRKQSESMYSQAETLLLDTLGMKNFTPSAEAINVKSFTDSFAATGRLDAEYYQPKYEELEAFLKSKPHSKLHGLVSFINHGKQPPYIENGTVRVFSQKWIGDKSIDYSFLKAQEEPFTSQEFADQYSEYVAKKNDVLYYSVGANLGYCHNYLIDEPIMPGSFITLIRPDQEKIHPVYFGVVLNSIVGRMQAEKWKSASAQPYIYPKDISEFLIPLIDEVIQKQIANSVQESLAYVTESERLLNVTKGAVEIAIEQDEAAGMAYIERNS